MRWLLALICGLGVVAQGWAGDAVSGRVMKVLPLFTDHLGHTQTSPSLYERDAYQALLRTKPAQRAGLEFAIQWKAKGPKATPLKLRLEARGGLIGQPPTQVVLELPLTPKGGWFGTWTSLKLGGAEYKKFGELTAWRVTLWDGSRRLSEEKSFLWEGELRLPPPQTNTVVTATNAVRAK